MRLLLLVLFSACAAAPGQFPPQLQLPPRAAASAAGPVTGSQLLPQITALSLIERERLLWHEFAAGNVPTFLRTLVPVTTTATLQGQPHTATFWVTPDYLGVGTDTDWFRMPMTPTLAQQVADRLDCVLPTRRMVDAIWNTAAVRLAPFPYSPASYNILAPSLFHQHHLQIESQRGNLPQHLLIAGIKKDVVASALIAAWPQRVVIYGWHYQNGTAIQPLSKVHTFPHVDYSHGVRLVARQMEVDGALTTVDAVLADPVLHALLSDEGAFASWRYPAGTDESFPVHDAFAGGVPQRSSWQAKFVAPVAIAAPQPPPSGDSQVARIMDPAGGTDSLRWSPGLVGAVQVQADIYCEYRPQLLADGFERVGLFARDQAQGAFVGTLSQAGACYALCWDSHDGRVRCARVQGGVVADLLPVPRFLPSTAWRRLRIVAEGDQLQFFVAGELLLATTDATFARGDFGIGYREYFASNANMRGTRVDSVHADVPGALALTLKLGQPGELRVQRQRGIPGDTCFTALSLARGAFPNGWFFGLDATVPDLLAQFASAHPAFVSRFDVAGASVFATAGLPPGLPLYAVAVALDPSGRVWLAAPPRTVTTR